MGGKARKTKKFAAVKRMLSPKDTRLYVHYDRLVTYWESVVLSKRERVVFDTQAIEQGKAEGRKQTGRTKTCATSSDSTVLQIQYAVRTALLCASGYKLYQFLHKKQTRYRALHDGLLISEMHTVYNRLRNGRIREIGPKIQSSAASRQGSSVRENSMWLQGDLRR
eukprot:gb/GECG01016556.1/.p1 GENE.gb/GECG01016556.1/~~gb/GECG01016556.1/.p1  ORF type:complete len:166 (+),score=13.50 gb/GECG01016556.1/:1-498(+)